MFEEMLTDRDGIQYFRAEYWMKDDSHFKEFSKSLKMLTSDKFFIKNDGELVEKSIPDLIIWLWADYALMPKQYFTCWHPYDKDGEKFCLSTFEDDFEEVTNEYLARWVGIPMWAELSIDEVDTSDANYDRTLEDCWGRRSFTNGWGKSQFLEKVGSALALIYASENAADGDLIFEPKPRGAYVHIIQSDPNWYRDQWTYYNWLDFAVTVDKKEIDREAKLIGVTFSSLSNEERSNLISVAIDSLKIKDLEAKKVPQYLLTLLLNHPATSDEDKARIVLLGDKHIIKLED